MKFSCTQENLTQGLSVVSHIAGKNVNLPILANVLVKIDDKIVRLLTTNLEVAVSVEIRGKVDATGEFSVPAKLFADFVSLVSGDRVDVELVGDSFEVRGGKSRTKIKGLPASEFPLVPQVSKDKSFRVPAADFRRAASKVIFAVSANESRPEISGVLLRFEPQGPAGRLTMAATDSYRLAEVQIPLHESPGIEARSVIVPARTLAEVLRILSSFKDTSELPATIELVLSENQILFSYGPVEVVSRTIEGQYPDYKAVIPEAVKTTVVLPRDELIKAVRSASLFSRSGLYDVHLSAGPGKLVVASADSQIGENETELAAAVEGGENKITLNYRYVSDGLAAIEGGGVVMKIIDSANPCVLLPQEDVPGMKYLYIVMPIKQ